MHTYWGYGLSILSEIEFPELLPFTFDAPDIHIRTGIVPDRLDGDDVLTKTRVSISPREYIIDIRDVARYYVVNGNEIIVQPYAGSDAESIRLFLLSNAMAAVLHQRNMSLMHASAVEYKDGIVMFCGRSGAGKSTMVSALQQQGYRVFSDDVCVLSFADGAGSPIIAAPSYPIIKLWQDSFEKVGLDAPKEESKLRPELAKYARFYHDDFKILPKKVLKVFILSPDKPVEEIEIKKTGSLESFKLLQRNTYRNMQMNAMKKRNLHFTVVSQLAGSVPVFTVDRPSHINSVSQMTGLIKTYLDD